MSRIKINELAIASDNFGIIGLVIAKLDFSTYQDKRDPSLEKGRFTFTIRDSQDHYVNCTYWGDASAVSNAFNRFKVGDSVDIFNPKVNLKQLDQEEKWMPKTTSPYHLHLGTQSSVQLYHKEIPNIRLFQRIPTQLENGFVKLGDVVSMANDIVDQFFNVLVIVRYCSSIQHIQTKDGRTINKRDMVFMDETCSGIQMTLWGSQIELSNTWQPFETIVFLTDVSSKINSFTSKSSNAATTSTPQLAYSRRLVVTNYPDLVEAQLLYQYSQSLNRESLPSLPAGVKFEKDDQKLNQMINFAELKNSTVVEVLQNLPEVIKIHGFVSTLRIDDIDHPVVFLKCKHCGKNNRPDSKCGNQECVIKNEPSSLQNDSGSDEWRYYFLFSVSDFSGTLDKIRVQGQAATEFLGIGPEEFYFLSPDEKMKTKYQLLFERCTVYCKILSPGKYDLLNVVKNV